MIDTEKVKAIVERFMTGTDMFLVEVKCSLSNDVEVVVDSDTNVSIDTCVALSRAIEAEFDRDVEDFELTVASAGLSEPLKLLRQYRKVLGRPVEVVLKSGEKRYATLTDADEESITIGYKDRVEVEGKKRKQTVEVSKRIPLAEIKSTKQQITF